jgi:acetoin utilization deacetylase AcuC-like enzyme
MSVEWLERFEEEAKPEADKEYQEHLERVERRLRLRRAFELARRKAWTRMLQVIEADDSDFAHFLRLHPELADEEAVSVSSRGEAGELDAIRPRRMIPPNAI